jgi:hypothetical protein
MHLTIATHYCQGEIAAIKVSFTGKSASCGMDMTFMGNSSPGTVLTKHCCDNELAVYNIDSYFSLSEYQHKINTINNAWFKDIPYKPFLQSEILFSHNNSCISPPGYYMANAVDITAIRVFRT